jgi:tetratricopeptide (TPR) repeat protein
MRALVVTLLVGLSASIAAADDPDARLVRLSERIARAPSDVDALAERADLLLQEDRLDEAAADLRLFEALAPTDPRMLLLRGLVAYERGDLGRAETDLEAWTSRTGGALVPCRLLATLYERSDREEEALRMYDAALAFGDDVDAHLAKGRLLEGLGRHVEAAASYEAALAGGAPSAALRARLVDLERRLGRHDRALAHVDAALREARLDTRWLVRRAEILDDAGRSAEARRARVAALAEAERLVAVRRSPAALAARGEALLALGRVDEAERDLVQAVSRAPRYARARSLLAEARRARTTTEVSR